MISMDLIGFGIIKLELDEILQALSLSILVHTIGRE
jgi:hypothetical protein